MARYATSRMYAELARANVRMDMSFQGEELDNYIVHMYNVFMLPEPWKSAADAHEIVYKFRRARGQENQWKVTRGRK